jgi:hypothetical protein
MENSAVDLGISSRECRENVQKVSTEGIFDKFVLLGTPIVLVLCGKWVVV